MMFAAFIQANVEGMQQVSKNSNSNANHISTEAKEVNDNDNASKAFEEEEEEEEFEEEEEEGATEAIKAINRGAKAINRGVKVINKAFKKNDGLGKIGDLLSTMFPKGYYNKDNTSDVMVVVDNGPENLRIMKSALSEFCENNQNIANSYPYIFKIDQKGGLYDLLSDGDNIEQRNPQDGKIECEILISHRALNNIAVDFFQMFYDGVKCPNKTNDFRAQYGPGDSNFFAVFDDKDYEETQEQMQKNSCVITLNNATNKVGGMWTIRTILVDVFYWYYDKNNKLNASICNIDPHTRGGILRGLRPFCEQNPDVVKFFPYIFDENTPGSLFNLISNNYNKKLKAIEVENEDLRKIGEDYLALLRSGSVWNKLDEVFGECPKTQSTTYCLKYKNQ